MEIAAEALSVPEILARIFYFIEPPKGTTLVAAACVCRYWSLLALETLWKGYEISTPDICMLHHLDKTSSLRKYLPLIKRLSLELLYFPEKRTPQRPLSKHGFCDHCNSHLTWLPTAGFDQCPNLDTVVISDASHALSLELWASTIPPNLRKLTCPGRKFPAGFLHMLSVRAPRLEELIVNTTFTEHNLSDNEKLEFYANMPYLTSIRKMGEDASLQTVLHLAARPNLKAVSLTLPPDLRVQRDVPENAFQRLTSLEVCQNGANGRLIPLSATLQDLNISLDLTPQTLNLLSLLHPLKELKFLSLYINAPQALYSAVDSMLAVPQLVSVFSNTRKIKSLSLVYIKGNIGRQDIGSADFESLITSLPRTVEELRLPYVRNCGRREVELLSLLPSIRSLGLSGVVYMDELRSWSDPIVVPSMEDIGWRSDSSCGDTFDINTSIITRVFPNLVHYFNTSLKFSWRVGSNRGNQLTRISTC